MCTIYGKKNLEENLEDLPLLLAYDELVAYLLWHSALTHRKLNNNLWMVDEFLIYVFFHKPKNNSY